ncbi:hypothetical protein INR49_000597 [Caranx melampygus]|nr:hypothetical protein INR49_000597 [Caranx melampygus]
MSVLRQKRIPPPSMKMDGAVGVQEDRWKCKNVVVLMEARLSSRHAEGQNKNGNVLYMSFKRASSSPDSTPQKT